MQKRIIYVNECRNLNFAISNIVSMEKIRFRAKKNYMINKSLKIKLVININELY